MSKSPGDVHALKKRLQKEFPCCQDAVGDLRKSLAFWDEVPLQEEPAGLHAAQTAGHTPASTNKRAPVSEDGLYQGAL